MTTADLHPDASLPEPRYAWVMLAVGTVLCALNLGALSSLSVFLEPVSQQFGWPRGDTYILLGAFGVAAVNVPIIANVGLWLTRRRPPSRSS
jgi:hypothetical protein